MRQATTAEVRFDTAKSARFSGSVSSTQRFAASLRAAGTIYPCPSRQKRDPWPRKGRNLANVGLNVVLGIGDAISISFPPRPIDCLVLRSAAAQPSPICARISVVREGAGDHYDHMSVRIGVGLLRSFQPADNELPGGSA